MPELIDSETLKSRIGELCLNNDYLFSVRAYERIICVIEAVPTIDAVPVVRCGECKHMMPNGFCEEFADRGIRPSVSDFCSYGERRADNG